METGNRRAERWEREATSLTDMCSKLQGELEEESRNHAEVRAVRILGVKSYSLYGALLDHCPLSAFHCQLLDGPNPMIRRNKTVMIITNIGF